jgi:hypothetical protein
MKPLLGDDDLSTISEGLNNRCRKVRDYCAQTCLIAVLEHVVKFGTGTNGDIVGSDHESEDDSDNEDDEDIWTDDDVDADEGNSSKRRRIE